MKLKVIIVIILLQLLLGTLTSASTGTMSIVSSGINESSEPALPKDNLKSNADDLSSSIIQNNSPCSNTLNEDVWGLGEPTKLNNLAYANNGSIELIVGLNDSSQNSQSKIGDVINRNRGTIVNKILIDDEVEAIIISLPLDSVSPFVGEIRDSALSNYVEPDLKTHIQFVPDDPYWSFQWGPTKIQADYAWNTTIGNPSVLVAVIDTGIDYNHPDLRNNYVSLGYNWVNNTNKTLDDNSHGTHCAGIIAAGINNSIGIAGLARVQIMAEKALDASGSGYIDWAASAIIHATDMGAKIISMSWGTDSNSRLLYDAIKYAYRAGVLLVAAAGNSATDFKFYPAAYDEVIAVAATDQEDSPASFTNFGDWIELAAPGVDIYSTVLDNGYSEKSGTSMAAPHVTGVAALVWSRFPSISRDQLRFHLRYTADDLGVPGFDVHYGYGRINAKKAVEQTLPKHDLLISDWNKPSYVEPNKTQIVDCTILNFGTHNESDVTVKLWANGTQVSNVTINELASGFSETVGLQWSSVEKGQYNVTLHVLPVQNETNTENNFVQAYIFAGFPLRVAVIRSAGTYLSEVTYTWESLNSRWHDFGDTIVSIDYTTLDKDNITYEDIRDTNASVLIISCAYAPENGWEFSNSEIDAIIRYTYEGHGLIITSGTFYYQVPNNSKLARLVGIDETTAWNATFTLKLNILEPQHPLFRNIPNPYLMSMVKSTPIPFDGKWDEKTLTGGKYVALGPSNESAIVTYRGLVYISPWVEISPGKNDMQLFYNAVTWSHYERPDHDLIVTLDAPPFLISGYSTLLNATVSNIGLQKENSVELRLLIDNNTVANVTIPELMSNSSSTLDYGWNPEDKKTCNVTAIADPVPNENNSLNNKITRLVSVGDPVIRPREGQWANYTVVSTANNETPQIKLMNLTYDHFVSPYQINVTYWFKSSFASITTSWFIVNIINRWVEKGVWAGWWYPGWIETNVTLGSEIRLLDSTATVISSRTIKVGNRSIDCWELSLLRYNANYTLFYDKPSGLFIGYWLVISDFRENLTLTLTNIPIGVLIHPKLGNYAIYEVVDSFDGQITATGTMNFTYVDYIDSRRFLIRVDYALFDTEGRLIESFADSIIVNIQTRQIESGPGDWNGTYYMGWIETSIELWSSVNVLNQAGTVVGTAEYILSNRLFNTWVIWSANENQTCIYNYDQVTGLLIKSMTRSLSLPSRNVTLTLLKTNVDVSPPFVVITQPEHNAAIPYTTFNVSWQGFDEETGIAYYLVYVDMGLVVNITRPTEYMTITITVVKEGTHTIGIEAYDLQGNIKSDEIDIVIDTAVPTASIIAPTNGSYLKGDSIIINVTGSDAISFGRMEVYTCDLLAATFFSEGLHSYNWKTGTYNGEYTITLIVYDNAGNRMSTNVTVTIDNISPVAEIIQPVGSDYVRGNCNVIFYAYDLNLKVTNLYADENMLSAWNTSGTHICIWTTKPTITDGAHTLRLVVLDRAGNEIEESIEVIVDNTPPIARIIFPTNRSYIQGTIDVAFDFSDDNLETATLMIDGEAFGVTETSFHQWNTAEVVDGEHVITLRVIDKAGNLMESTVKIFTDNTKPTTIITSPASDAVVSGIIEIRFTATDSNLINASLVLNDTTFNMNGNASFTLDTKILLDNSYTINLIAIDAAGNQAEDSTTIVVDNTYPNVSISAPPNGAKLMGTVAINFTTYDEHMASAFLYIDNMPFNVTGQTSYEWNSSTAGDGLHVIKIIATDKAGNSAETFVQMSTVNTQEAVYESLIFGICLGVLIGAVVSIAIGILALYIFARKHRSSLKPSKVQ